MVESRTFRTSEVAARAGVSLRQLQWWDEQGLLVPTAQARPDIGRIRWREYTYAEAVLAGVYGELRRRGFSLYKLRRLMPRGRTGDLTSCAYLVVNGKVVEFAETQGQVIKAAVKHRKPVMLLVLDDIRQRFT